MSEPIDHHPETPRTQRHASVARIDEAMRVRQRERERAFTAELQAWRNRHVPVEDGSDDA
jgi:hypothetical protein